MMTAPNGQSAKQRPQPLQFFGSTTATGPVRFGGSHGSATSSSVAPPAIAQTAPCPRRSNSGYRNRKNQSSATLAVTVPRSAGPWLSAGFTTASTSSAASVPTTSDRGGFVFGRLMRAMCT